MDKNEKSKNIIIVILIIMIIGLAGLLCYQTFAINNESEKNKTIENSEETRKEEATTEEKKESIVYSVDDPKISNLIDKLASGLYCNEIEEYVNNKKVDAKNIKNVRAFIIAEGDYYDSGAKTVSLEEMNKTIQKYLGKNYIFNPDSINYENMCSGLKYDSKSKIYVQKGIGGCGGVCSPERTRYKIVKAIDENNILKLDIKVIFAGDKGFYSDYSKTNKIGEFGDNIDYLYEKGSIYQFTFELINGYYAFVSSEKI